MTEVRGGCAHNERVFGGADEVRGAPAATGLWEEEDRASVPRHEGRGGRPLELMLQRAGRACQAEGPEL